MTECGKVIADNLVREGTIKFYVCYVDDTLLLVRRHDIDKVLKVFNEFDKNLRFTLINSRTKHHISWIQKYASMAQQFFEETLKLDSALTWSPLLCENGNPPESDHMLIKQRKYVQKKTFQKNFNQ